MLSEYRSFRGFEDFVCELVRQIIVRMLRTVSADDRREIEKEVLFRLMELVAMFIETRFSEDFGGHLGYPLFADALGSYPGDIEMGLSPKPPYRTLLLHERFLDVVW
jgi:hypothetical protein